MKRPQGGKKAEAGGGLPFIHTGGRHKNPLGAPVARFGEQDPAMRFRLVAQLLEQWQLVFPGVLFHLGFSFGMEVEQLVIDGLGPKDDRCSENIMRTRSTADFGHRELEAG